ncbi:MAG: glycosyltransferase, partial [Candidatus Kapaibacterium sp.]
NPFWQNAVTNATTEIKPDIIIVREIMLGTQAAATAKKMNIPVILDMAENYPALMLLWKKYRYGLFNRLIYHKLRIAEITEKIVVPRMSGILLVCSEQIERLTSLYNYPEDKISVVHNTVSREFGKNIRNNPQSRKLPDDDVITFCHHGYLTDEKKINVFLEALLRVKEHENRFRFIIAGSGESYDELIEIHKSHGEPRNVIFKGTYDYVELPKILANCDYGVLPYQINDFNEYTIHNKIFDYFAFSKPVIVSQVKPLSRIIGETSAGIIADFSEPGACMQLFDKISSCNYNQMSFNAGKAFTDKYHWEKDSDTLIKFLSNYL